MLSTGARMPFEDETRRTRVSVSSQASSGHYGLAPPRRSCRADTGVEFGGVATT
jgi:hypothetical protein